MANIVSCVNFAWIRANRGRIWEKKGANLAKICANRVDILAKKVANLSLIRANPARIRINPLLICMLIRALMCFNFFKILFLPFALTKMRYNAQFIGAMPLFFKNSLHLLKCPHPTNPRAKGDGCGASKMQCLRPSMSLFLLFA